jgi:hypothetical protein
MINRERSMAGFSLVNHQRTDDFKKLNMSSDEGRKMLWRN